MNVDTQAFEETLKHFSADLQHIRTGRAAPSLIESITVEAYGSVMRLQELAAITAPEAQTLVIQPWDSSTIRAIETALRDCDFHFNPVVDGQILRINFPPLTEEKRREMVKIVNQKAEDARISVRKVREEQLKKAKDAEKKGELSEDQLARFEKDMQSAIEDANGKIKAKVESKEKELMTI
ncbi:MAG: ribosome recycling factor [Candidatus Kerfeldbacteria bacterium]|nr:ribosome recycling factor [Candidatus Kerfeldbacteria bacterium]